MNEKTIETVVDNKQIAEASTNDMISAADNPIQAIAKMAASGVGTEIVEQMKNLIEWDDARKAKSEFNKAFSKAKNGFKKAKQSGLNKSFNPPTRYSKLEDYDDATKESLSENGLSWRHTVKTLEGDITEVTCILAHECGHYEETTLRAPSHSMTNNAVNKLQSTGIVGTYLKRMTLSAILGLVSDTEFDNDGQGGKKIELVTEEQVITLQSVIDEIKDFNYEGFFKWVSDCTKIEISELKNIPAKHYTAILHGLEEKRKGV